ncbi:hypothetical protein ACWCXX_23875 [Streptomyces sp. NPDC001732]
MVDGHIARALIKRARRLLYDDTIRTEGRLAGLPLLLHAQGPVAISRLTAGHIEETNGTVRIRLGDIAVTLSGPVAGLAREQAAAGDWGACAAEVSRRRP